MLNRWKKTDIALVILAALTILAYFLFPSWAFKLLLWSSIITGVVRLLFIAKRRLFWKIRNRLIFSGLFLVATPLIFITIFFYFIGTVAIAQYGRIIVDNLMADRMAKLEPIHRSYLRYNNPDYMKRDVRRFIDVNAWIFVTVFWENRNGSYQPFLKFPPSLDEKKIIVDDFRGYFMVNDRLYLGILEANDNLAVLMAYEVNQEMLDNLSTISDFRVIYKSPRPYVVGPRPPGTDMPAADPTAPMTVESPGLTEEMPVEVDEDSNDAIALAVFTYDYLDYNTVVDGKPLKREGDFNLSMDYGKIYKKIVTAMSSPAHRRTKQLVFALIIPLATLIIISFLIGFRMVRVITRSINQLTRGTQRIRNGDFSFRIRTRSGDQLQYLAESFNEMASGIDRLLIDEKEKQRLEEELRIARSIQLKLLPPDAFRTDDFEIAAVNIPAAEIAGDYFDYFYKKDTYLSILVADVSGKGASAAFYMAELKGVINHLSREAMSPASLIAECHHSLKQSFDKVTFITMNMAQFRIPERKFVLARAGHTRAIFYSSKEEKCLELFPEGMAIGLINFSADKIKEIEKEYQSGDLLFLFSDGLSEIMNEEEEMLGIDNLKRILCENHDQSAEDIKQKLLDFSIKFSDSGINRDDLTFIILKVN
jgi:serine phosphatase RsbU (regulator of sigma subunit)